MKRIIKIIYVVFIFAILCIPVGFMKNYKSENTENRELAELPSINDENFGEKFDSYISDNFAFRNVFINAESKIMADIFKVSANESVTVGKNGWLFFSEDIDDYTAKATLSDREVFCVVRTLEMISDFVEKNNGKFIFMTAPNKASVYDEFLLNCQKRNVPNNLEKIEAKLKNINYLDVNSIFDREDEILYHRLDSHWNNKGALLVTNELLNLLGRDKLTLSEPELRKDWDGDLYKMLFPAMEEKDEEYYYKDSEFTYSYAKRFKSTDDMIIETENKESHNGNILLFRDSFGRSMLPFVAQSFSKATLSRTVPYNIEQIESKSYDYVVLEIVERNLDNLINKAPYMEALKSQVNIDELKCLNADEYEITSEKGELNHIYGNILTALDENTKIYVCLDNEFYEAFPCYELEENEIASGMGNGFSLYTDNNSENVKIYITK